MMRASSEIVCSCEKPRHLRGRRGERDQTCCKNSRNSTASFQYHKSCMADRSFLHSQSVMWRLSWNADQANEQSKLHSVAIPNCCSRARVSGGTHQRASVGCVVVDSGNTGLLDHSRAHHS